MKAEQNRADGVEQVESLFSTWPQNAREFSTLTVAWKV
jgi:hypothetical protein